MSAPAPAPPVNLLEAFTELRLHAAEVRKGLERLAPATRFPRTVTRALRCAQELDANLHQVVAALSPATPNPERADR